MQNTKRSRSTNWEQVEKELLRDLISQYIEIVENKTTDTKTNTKKKSAWLEIHKRFNDLNCKKRDLTHIQQQWRTMKWDARKGLSNYKHSQKTGDEKPPSPKPSSKPVELMVFGLGEGENIFDCDGRSNLSVQDDKNSFHESDGTPPASCSFTAFEEVETVNVDVDASSLAYVTENDEAETPMRKKPLLNLAKKYKKLQVPKDDTQHHIIRIIKKHKDDIRLIYKQKVDLEMQLLRDQHFLDSKMKHEKHALEMRILNEKLKSVSK